jgi:hypothetical protein
MERGRERLAWAGPRGKKRRKEEKGNGPGQKRKREREREKEKKCIQMHLNFNLKFKFKWKTRNKTMQCDEDITSLDAHNTPLNIRGPITRVRARQLNL